MNQVSKPKTRRKKQNKEMSIDVVMENLVLEVPADESDTMAVIKDVEKEIKPETKQRRPRKPKIQELQEHPAAIPEALKEVVKEVVSSTKKPSNPWVEHIRNFAKEKGLTYNKAMIDPDLKKTYVKTVSVKNMVSAP
jgi:Tfp pilus assembly protein PilO